VPRQTAGRDRRPPPGAPRLAGFRGAPTHTARGTALPIQSRAPAAQVWGRTGVFSPNPAAPLNTAKFSGRPRNRSSVSTPHPQHTGASAPPGGVGAPATAQAGPHVFRGVSGKGLGPPGRFLRPRQPPRLALEARRKPAVCERASDNRGLALTRAGVAFWWPAAGRAGHAQRAGALHHAPLVVWASGLGPFGFAATGSGGYLDAALPKSSSKTSLCKCSAPDKQAAALAQSRRGRCVAPFCCSLASARAPVRRRQSARGAGALVQAGDVACGSCCTMFQWHPPRPPTPPRSCPGSCGLATRRASARAG